MLMRWPSGSALATYFAATTPPAPRRFSTMTGTPRLADIFSATTRAIVSEALPGVTPETRRTVLLGNVCAFTAENANANSSAGTLIGIVLNFWQPEALRQPVPDLRPVERTRERDAGLEALLVRRGTRRVVAAEANAPDCHFFRIEIVSLLDPIGHRARRTLVVAADRDLVLGLALPRAVDRERRHAAAEEGLLVGMQLFFCGVEPRGHHHDGAV